MFSKTKILGVALATLVAVAFIACGGGSGDKAKLEASCTACNNHFLGFDDDGDNKCNPSTYKNDCKTLLTIYKEECDKGNGESCHKAGESYLETEGGGCLLAAMAGGKCDPIEAVSWLKKSCDLKNGNGCEQLAYVYEFQMRDKDKAREIYTKQVMPIYEKECDNGDINSCANAGDLLVRGYQVERDYHKGLQLLQKYCDKVKGKDKGIYHCITLGDMYMNSKGTTQDYEQAKKYFKKVCDMGEQEGCDAYKKANEKSK